jgi:hypothetical protein
MVIYSFLKYCNMLCDDGEIGEHTRDFSWQRLDKHIPVARQQILNNKRVGL